MFGTTIAVHSVDIAAINIRIATHYRIRSVGDLFEESRC